MKNRVVFRVGQALAAFLFFSFNAGAQPASGGESLDAATEATSEANANTEPGIAVPDEATPPPTILIPVPIDPATLVPQRPDNIPSVVWSYRAVFDTNAVIGKPFQPGSTDFIMAIAGVKPPEPVPVPVQEPGPVIIYRPAEIGSGAIMTREVEGEGSFYFATGASLSRPTAQLASAAPIKPLGRGILLPEPATTETGEMLIRNFPPGAFLRR